MAPKKKTSNMVWVVKSKQPAKMAEPATGKKTSSVMSDSSVLPDSVSKLQLSSSPSAKMATKEHTSSDWSLLPEELLHIISEKLDDCFDVFCARSVCRLWRSIFPFPSCPERTRYSLPSFAKFPLGYMCRMIGWDPNSLATSYRGVALLPLNKEGRDEFVVLIGYAPDMLVLRSTEMRWVQVENTSRADCSDIVTFRGKFYAVFINGDVFAIDPYFLETTPLRPSEIVGCGRCNYLVSYGDDELYLVERIIVRNAVLNFSKLACRVSRLDEEAGEWVVVTDLGDRVLLIGQPGNSSGNSSCSAKELPDGCGVSGNSMLFINEIFDETYPYKYGVDTGNPEDDLNFWRCSRETRVTILKKSPMVALRIVRAEL